MSDVIGELEAMNRSTETEFLTVGERLMGYMSSARLVLADMEELAQLIAGEQGKHAFQAFASALDDAGRMRSDAEGADLALSALRDSAHTIRRSFTGLEHLSISFRMVATLAEIEMSRLGNARTQLGGLAGSVRSYSEEIHARVQRVLETVAAMERRVENVLDRISQATDSQLRMLPSLIAGVKANMEEFNSRSALAVAASEGLTSRLESFSNTIGNIVESIQFHDITRQQVEHVIESLNELVNFDAERGHSPAPSAVEAKALVLQVAQLASASSTFQKSVDQIRRDLETVAMRMQEMAAESRGLMGLTDNGHASLFTEMERGLTRVLETFAACQHRNSGAVTAMDEMEESAGRVRDGVAEIHSIAADFRRLSINAKINAVHMGAPGDALGVLADAIQGLVADCESRAAGSAEAMDGMTSTIASLREANHREEDVTVYDNPAVLDDLHATIDELRNSSERSSARSAQITDVVAELSADVQSVRAAFSAGRRFGDTVETCGAVLRRIAGECDVEEAEDATSLDDLIDRSARRYAMRTERDIHEAHLGNVAAEPVVSETTGDGVQHELGDNVELF